MTLAGAGSLHAFSVTARNTAADSENKIHDDAEARRYGYGGGLVPGVTLYAYLTRLALAAYGPVWLERGTAECGFRRPVYEGETVRCEGERLEAAPPDAEVEVRVLRDGGFCAGGTFGLGAEGARPFATVPAGPPPAALLPELRPESVPIGVPLAPLHGRMTVADAAAYAESTDDPTPRFRDGSPFGGTLVPPGWLAARQASLLRRNFRFGPSIHARSIVRHLAPAFAGRDYVTSGVIRETYERNGNHYLVLEAETRDDEDRSVCQILHTSIFSVRQVEC
jgi:acyl dehydratase